ncbi:hypothetical protein HF576_02825 [Microbacterium sp. CFH 90308]|uniref:ABC transporter-associated repeat protein n=1 Tax=Microbacterium salsuginis TaxID=2722803 RepID=A0ABX1K9G1_9MICO|nr:TIGR03773 family transporter-associated surface protein [Microbacterium sp. CFH 90308]NLP82770.1 hypothetical protein [Microbacterium sp. CFH 90308]
MPLPSRHGRRLFAVSSALIVGALTCGAAALGVPLTPEPTPTLTPESTHTPVPTHTPTPTPEPTATPTREPTATPTPSPTPAPGQWDVRNGTINDHGAVVLNDGHVDVAATLEADRLVSRIKDTTESSDPVWRDPGDTVLQILPHATATVPTGAAWDFLGPAGSSFFQVSQTQQEGLLWPGWSTESIPSGATSGGVAWSLADIEGPGEFALYESDSFGQPRVLLNSRDGVSSADAFTIPKNTHAHGSWAFSAEGVYCLAMQRAAQLSDGRAASESFVLTVAVGTVDVVDLDPVACADSVEPDPGTVPSPPPPVDGTPGAVAPPVQEVAATQCTAAATILSAGHIDYASRLVDGRLQSLIGDDTSGSKVYREPAGTVLWLKPSARVALPAGFGQIGAPGQTVWQVPQTQNAELIWLGWNTESLNAGNARGPVRWTIDAVNGPGAVKVYLSGSFGGVQQMVFDGGGTYGIPLGVHAHANWAFTAEGVYRITSTQTMTLADGSVSSDTETMTIVVGDVDPRSATGGVCGAPAVLALTDDDSGQLQSAVQSPVGLAAWAVDPSDSGSGPQADGADPEAVIAASRGAATPTLLGVLGALLLLAAAACGFAWRRALIQPSGRTS